MSVGTHSEALRLRELRDSHTESPKESAPEEAVRTVQTGGHARPCHVQACSHSRGRLFFKIPHPDDLTIRRGEPVDHFQENPRQLASVCLVLGILASGGRHDSPALAIAVASTSIDRDASPQPRCLVPCLITNDGSDPSARGRRTAVLPDSMEHGDPALLQDIVRHWAAAGYSPSYGQEASRTASDPLLMAPLQQRAVDSVPQRRCHSGSSACRS